MHFRTLTLTLVVVMLQFMPVARAQSFDGAFRGTLVCEKMLRRRTCLPHRST